MRSRFWKSHSLRQVAHSLSAGAWAAAARPAPEQLRRDLAKILARPEFRPSPDAWLWASLQRWLARLLSWWREHVGTPIARLAEEVPFVYWAIVIATALLAVLLLYHIYMLLKSAFKLPTEQYVTRLSSHRRPQTLDPVALRAEAEKAAAEARFAEALRCLYLALIAQLDQRRLLRYHPAHTNGDYLRQIQAWPAIATSWREISHWADRVIYGRYSINAAEYARCRKLAEALWQEADNVAAP